MTTTLTDPLSLPQVQYFPYENGKWEVKAGLAKLGQHEVHGRVEQRAFMLDEHYGRYLANKQQIRQRDLHRHYLQAALTPALRRRALAFLYARLAEEYPEGVTWEAATGRFANRWLGWSARIDVASGGVVVESRTAAPLAHLAEGPEPIDAFDYFAANVPEDFALVARDPERQDDWLPLVHICAPHFWDPRDKVGRAFGPVHAPVADIEPITAAAPRLMRALVEQGPFFRFAWGMALNDQLNHHPDHPHGGDRDLTELSDDYLDEHLFVRVERQTVWGFPEEQGALFTIRPYWYRVRDLAGQPERLQQLASALQSMQEPSLTYKGLSATRDTVVAYIQSLL